MLGDDEKKILANGDFDGRIQLWNLNNNVSMKTVCAHSRVISTLGAVQCNGKVCLTSGSLGKTFKIWDLQNDCVIKTLDNGKTLYL